MPHEQKTDRRVPGRLTEAQRERRVQETAVACAERAASRVGGLPALDEERWKGEDETVHFDGRAYAVRVRVVVERVA